MLYIFFFFFNLLLCYTFNVYIFSYCKNGTWICETNICPATCQVFGDPHFVTFDGLWYNYEAIDCPYILAENYCGYKNGTFMISSENIACGSDGVTCTKKISFKLHGDEVEMVRGNRPYILHNHGEKRAHITIKETGLFYFFFADDDGMSTSLSIISHKIIGFSNDTGCLHINHLNKSDIVFRYPCEMGQGNAYLY